MQRTTTRRLAAAATALCLSVGLAACDGDASDDMENIEENVEEGVSEVEEGIEDTGDAIEEGTDELTENDG